MKRIDKFLLNDLCKIPLTTSIAFALDEIKPYNTAWASIRIKCYDVINYLNSIGIRAELHKPFKHYKVVIFVKTSSHASVKRAKRLASKGVRIIYNAYCDHLLDESKDDEERRNTIELINLSSDIIVCTKEQYHQFSHFHRSVHLVYESVPDEFFLLEKEHTVKEKPVLVYCGYAHKAKDTLYIMDVLNRLIKENKCELLYICNKDPKIRELEYRYVHYEQERIFEQLLLGDIAIAPRNMEGIEKLSHSFTKVALTGAIGLPTVASPIPSYLDTPVIICKTEEEWFVTLQNLICDVKQREHSGKELRKHIRDYYSMDIIGEQYRKIFKV